MFRNKFKHFPTTLFVIASIIILLAFIILYYIIAKENYFYNYQAEAGQSSNSKFFINEDYEDKDPYTTKVPNLRDMLAGPIITDLDPSKGNINSDVSVVVFADFECNYYKRGAEIIESLVNEYDLRLVWKDYPSNDTESRSYRASLAARCAQLEGAFWDYHDKLFSGDYSYDRDGFLAIADDLHLDTEEFISCFDNKKTNQLIYDNMLEADALGIDGIPFIYVNDQQLQGEINEKLLRKLIEVEVANE